MSERKTVFSDCRKWRYTLWREWGIGDLLSASGEAGINSQSYLMVIGLNPSTADETKDDPTIRKCIGFAKRWGYGALCMTNLFAWRDTLPKNMKKAAEPIGPDNDRWLAECAAGARMVLGAWGTNGSFMNRANAVADLIPQGICCLTRNNDGSPMHPLYVPYDITPDVWTWPKNYAR